MKILFRQIIFFLVLCILNSCKNSKKDVDKDVGVIENQGSVTLPKLPEIRKLLSETKDKTNEWEEFKKFEEAIHRIYKGGDNLTEAEAALAGLEEIFVVSKFPVEFNIPPIKSRFLILKTFLLQLKEAAAENAPSTEIQEYKTKVMEIYNSLLVQFDEALSKSIADEFLSDK